jgi:hypothetical protein
MAAPPPPAPADGFTTFSTVGQFWSNYRDAANGGAGDSSIASAVPDKVYHRGAVPIEQLPPPPLEVPPASMPATIANRSASPPPSLSAHATEWLSLHNNFRALHHAPPLVWDARLASGAGAWARNCLFQHSSPNGAYGENLYASTNVPNPVVDSVNQWYNEISSYDFGAGGFAEATGHFTQVIWLKTTHLGCGVATNCTSIDGYSVLVVCRYTPAGNVIGDFQANVLPQ